MADRLRSIRDCTTSFRHEPLSHIFLSGAKTMLRYTDADSKPAQDGCLRGSQAALTSLPHVINLLDPRQVWTSQGGQSNRIRTRLSLVPRTCVDPQQRVRLLRCRCVCDHCSLIDSMRYISLRPGPSMSTFGTLVGRSSHHFPLDTYP